MQQQNSISNWDETRLVKFIRDTIDNNPTKPQKILIVDEITCKRILRVADEIQFAQPGTTVGAAGSASALPATPELYVKVLDPYGKIRLLPLYRSS